MKALTIIQPWTTLIAIGAKQYETRSWSTKYRGPIAIHAGKKWDRELIGHQMRAVHILRAAWGVDDPRVLAFEENPPLGAVVAVADLVDCLPTCQGYREPPLPSYRPLPWVARLTPQERAFGDFSFERFGWRLENVRRLSKPYEIKGRQGLWDLPLDVARDLDRQMTLCP